ncbi:MAG: hypothetical protein OHK006_21000 [Thermodesulfovibrionales bacterium]
MLLAEVLFLDKRLAESHVEEPPRRTHDNHGHGNESEVLWVEQSGENESNSKVHALSDCLRPDAPEYAVCTAPK